MTDREHKKAFVALHPRGFYWVRDEQHVRAMPPGTKQQDAFVAFFTGDDEVPLWSYPGDDPRYGSGRPFDHPTVIERVPEPGEIDEARRVDALVLKMWSSHQVGPGHEWPPPRPAPMTMLSAYGRQMVCPGDPDDVVAFFHTSGFEATLTCDKDGSSWSVLVRAR